MTAKLKVHQILSAKHNYFGTNKREKYKINLNLFFVMAQIGEAARPGALVPLRAGWREKCDSERGKALDFHYFDYVESRMHLRNTKKNKFSFGISLDLDKFLTLKNTNIFEFFSLNRNFSLPLQAKLKS